MKYGRLNSFEIEDKIRMALQEDIHSEDLSTNAIYREQKKASISLIMKEEGIVAGLEVFQKVFLLLDNTIRFDLHAQDGDPVKKGQIIADIHGDVRTILSGERVAINYLQRMSGIATYTNQCVVALDDSNILLMDTRKTTPNMRIFEKYAVKVGGGHNHRYNLSDGIMLKDNHIDAAGSISKAIEMAKDYAPFVKKIEIEVEDLEGVKEALEAKADIIMLDNMPIDMVKEAVDLIDGKAIIECSGNIDKNNISRYKGIKIDYVSSGAITHSAPPLDISMKNLRYENETTRQS